MDNSRLDMELPCKMASLDLVENNGLNINEESNLSVRSLRRRPTHSPNSVKNRRVIMKPRKKEFKMNMNEEEIKKYYLNQKVNNRSQTLETIFEEPKCSNSGTTILIGSKKIKRSLNFHVGPGNTKDKIKKRRVRIKRLIGVKDFLKRQKLPMQTFIENLQSLDPDEPLPNIIEKDGNTRIVNKE